MIQSITSQSVSLTNVQSTDPIWGKIKTAWLQIQSDLALEPAYPGLDDKLDAKITGECQSLLLLMQGMNKDQFTTFDRVASVLFTGYISNGHSMPTNQLRGDIIQCLQTMINVGRPAQGYNFLLKYDITSATLRLTGQSTPINFADMFTMVISAID